MYGNLEGGRSKVPAARNSGKTVEIAKKDFISLKAYIDGTKTQKLKSLAQRWKNGEHLNFDQFWPILTKILEVAKIYEVC